MAKYQPVFTLEANLYLEGVKYPAQLIQLVLAEGQPARLVASIPMPEELLSFIGYAIQARPRVTVTARLRGETSTERLHWKRDRVDEQTGNVKEEHFVVSVLRSDLEREHVLFDGVLTGYTYQITNQGVTLTIMAQDTLSLLLSETSLVSISPGGVLDVPRYLAANVTVGSLNTLVELLSALVTGEVDQVLSGLLHLGGIITKRAVPTAYVYGLPASGGKYPCSNEWLANQLASGNVHDASRNVLNVPAALGAREQTPAYESGRLTNHAKTLRGYWDSWSRHVVPRLKATAEWKALKALFRDRGYEDPDRAIEGLLFSTFATEHARRDSCNQYTATGCFQITHAAWKQFHRGVLTAPELADEVPDAHGHTGGNAPTVVSQRLVALGIPTAEAVVMAKHLTDPLASAHIALRYYAQQAKVIAKKLPSAKGGEFVAALALSYNGGVGNATKGRTFSEVLLNNLAECEKSQANVDQRVGYAIQVAGKGGWMDYFVNEPGEEYPELARLEDSAGCIEKVEIGPKFGRPKIEPKNEENVNYVWAEDFEDASWWIPAPFLGKLRPALDSVLVPSNTGSWRVLYQLLGTMMQGRLGEMNLFSREANVYSIFNFAVNELIYSLVPTPAVAWYRDEKPRIVRAIVKPVLTSPDPEDEIGVPRFNHFRANQFSDSVQVVLSPTAIYGYISEETSLMQGLWAVYPSELETQVDEKVRINGESVDEAIRSAFTVEEHWRGPNRIYKSYSSMELSAQAFGQGSSKLDAVVEQLRRRVKFDFAQLSLLPETMSFNVPYEPRVAIGQPAEVQVYGVRIRGILAGVTFVFHPAGFSQTITLRSAYSSFVDVRKLLRMRLGEAKHGIDPWLPDEEIDNLRLATRLWDSWGDRVDEKIPAFTTAYLEHLIAEGYFVRKQLHERLTGFARWLARTGFQAVPEHVGRLVAPWVDDDGNPIEPEWIELKEFVDTNVTMGEATS